ncbi:hypothetical protein IT568_00025 [bacterium]|nr:hypothetical protein [bacterium]
MQNSFQKLKIKLPFLVGFLSFFLAGYDASVNTSDFVFGRFYFFIALLNIVCILVIEKLPDFTKILAGFINVTACFISSYFMFQANKKGLPFAYALAGLMFTVLTYKDLKKVLSKNVDD